MYLRGGIKRNAWEAVYEPTSYAEFRVQAGLETAVADKILLSLGAIAFLAQYGFMGIRVLRNYYQSRLALEDGYLMRYSTNPTHVINRLRGHFAKLNEAREMFTGTPKLKNAFHQ